MRPTASLLLIALALTGCGSSPDAQNQPTPEPIVIPVPPPAPKPATTPAAPPQAKTVATYHLTFDDEFNTFDPSRWQTADFWGMRNNPGDYQGQWFCDPGFKPKEEGQKSFNPFEARDGILSITAQPTPEGVPTGKDKLPFVSGQITSAHKFTQRYGYFELRAKLPPGKGLWSRFWLLTDDGVWPGEYDIFEILGKHPGEIHQTTHFRDIQRQHASYGSSYKGINPTDGQFHTYGFLWEKTGVTWFVDGVPTLQQINRIDIPMYVLIDIVVGKDPKNLWPGDPDPAMQWPVAMELDYYRVYSNDPSLPSVTPDKGYTPSVLPYGFHVATAPNTPRLPPGWTSGDIAGPELKGSSTWSPDSGEWLLKGAGFGNQCHFVGVPHAGDGMITGTVTAASIINSNEVRAGVAFRDGRNAKSNEVSLTYQIAYDSPKVTHSVVLQARGDKPTVELERVKNLDPPVGLRLIREGNTFTGTYSPDGGRTWIPVGKPHVIEMPAAAEAGLVVGGNQSNYQRLSRAFMSDVTVEALKK